MPEIIAIPTFLNRDAYLKVIPLFLNELDECKSQINLAEKKNDFNQIKATAHKIKGSASTYGAEALHIQAEIVEKRITDGQLKNIEEEINFLKLRIAEFINKVEHL